MLKARFMAFVIIFLINYKINKTSFIIIFTFIVVVIRFRHHVWRLDFGATDRYFWLLFNCLHVFVAFLALNDYLISWHTQILLVSGSADLIVNTIRFIHLVKSAFSFSDILG